jgi:hypothetical protein
MNSSIPPYPQKPNKPVFNAEDTRLIRKWLTERVATQNLIETVKSLPTAMVGFNGHRATIQ